MLSLPMTRQYQDQATHDLRLHDASHTTDGDCARRINIKLDQQNRRYISGMIIATAPDDPKMFTVDEINCHGRRVDGHMAV